MQSLLRLTTLERRTWMVLLLTTLTVVAIAVVSRKVLDVPKSMIVTLLVCLLTWSVPFGLLGIARGAGWLRETTWLVLPWIALSLAVLGGVYYVDRGGWLWFQVSGVNSAIAEHFPTELGATPAEFVRRHPEFTLDPMNGAKIQLRRGEHTFSRTVVVPRGTELTIDPGAILYFGAGCSLISYSPIIARGKGDLPIQFLPRHSWLKWGVVGLVDAGNSLFEHAYFSCARQAYVNDVDFPGGLSFIRTTGEIRNSQFQRMFGKDAVYLCQAHVTVRNNRIDGAFKDGIDSDGSTGVIRDNLVIDCEDEGIDLSDNLAIEVHGNTIRDRRGGRIAATDDLPRIRESNLLEALTIH